MFRRHVCWDEKSAKAILRPLALEGNEAIFRATHSAITGLVVGGPQAHEVAHSTEEGLLAALAAAGQQHAMCVVEGEAGSGKSHLIRWLKVHWPIPSDVVVLIERSDGTLDGTLRQLQQKLSTSAAANVSAVVPQKQLSDKGQQGAFLSQLETLMRPGMVVNAFPDEVWCAQHGVADLLQAPAVRAGWGAPARVLEVLTRGVERDSAIARFVARDILELARLTSGLKGKNVGPGAIRLGYKLREEASAVESAVAEARDQDPVLTTAAPVSAQLIAALNTRLNSAVQSAMGISGTALQKMFRDLRRELRARTNAPRLVLLLEDITSAQGVDQDLIYALQERSTTSPELCDVVGVVGITPSYFAQHMTQGNVVQRITHHVRFGEKTSSFQAVSSLATEEAQWMFAARYLRAVRAGLEDVEAAHREDRPPHNRCTGCEWRDECHRAFGEVSGTGLYPLTAKAIGRMFRSLRDPTGRMLLQTPRALIQSVLAPTFASGVNAVREGSYPPSSVETDWHGKERFDVTGIAEELVDQQEETVRERLRVTVRWWGDGAFPQEGSQPEEWAGVPVSVLKAFELPVPPQPSDAGEPTAVTVPEEQSGEPTLESSAAEPTAAPAAEGSEKKAATRVPRKSRAKTPEFEVRLKRIRQWTKTKKIEDDGTWHELAKGFLETIAWRHYDLSHWFTTGGLGEVRLEGSGKLDSRNFVIPCEPWAAKGLEWAACLREGVVAPQERDVAVRYVKTFGRRLVQVMEQWIEARTPRVDGTPWRFTSTVAQVLLTRAWLRGEASPRAPLVEQWELILSDDSTAGARRRPGALAWNTAVNTMTADAALHPRLRTLVQAETGFAYASEVVAAMRRLCEDGEFTPFPTELPDQPAKTKWFVALSESSTFARATLAALPTKEATRLRDRVEQITSTVGGAEFASYVARADAAITRCREELHTVATEEIAAYMEARDHAAPLLALGTPAAGTVIQFLADGVPEECSSMDLLERLLAAPVEELETVCDLVDRTARTVRTLVSYLAPRAQHVTEQHDPAAVNRFGRALVEAADAIARRLA